MDFPLAALDFLVEVREVFAILDFAVGFVFALGLEFGLHGGEFSVVLEDRVIGEFQIGVEEGGPVGHFHDEAECRNSIGLVDGGRLIAEGSPDVLKELAATKEDREPTMEDALIALIEGREEA